MFEHVEQTNFEETLKMRVSIGQMTGTKPIFDDGLIVN